MTVMGKTKKVRADRRKKRKFCGNRFTKRESTDNESGDRLADAAQTHGDVTHCPHSSTDTDIHVEQDHSALSSSSATKLDTRSEESIQFDQEEILTGFRFIDCENLIDFVSHLSCPNCKQPLGANRRLFHVTEKNISKASQFIFHCHV